MSDNTKCPECGAPCDEIAPVSSAKPTIAELEAILGAEGRNSVRMLPSGEITRQRFAYAPAAPSLESSTEADPQLILDAERWRAVEKHLTVRNHALNFTHEELPEAFTRKQSWLESKYPLEIFVLTPADFADFLRARLTSSKEPT